MHLFHYELINIICPIDNVLTSHNVLIDVSREFWMPGENKKYYQAKAKVW